jgi:RNAse (barnase) inhibitor barstar
MSSPSSDFFQTLIGDPTRAGVYRFAKRYHDDIERGAGAAACCVFHVDLARARNKEDLLNLVGRGLAFPEWFGHNWDALSDCLLDMGWRPALGYLVILKNAEMVHSRAEQDFASLLQIFSECADQRREEGVPLWCLVELSRDDLPTLASLPTPPDLP